MKIAAFAAASATAFASVSAETYFSDDFNSGDLSKWVAADRENLGEFVLSPGEYYLDEDDLGLKTSGDARFYGMAAKFSEPFDNMDQTMVVQLSVKHQQEIDCGGGYVKIYPDEPDLDLATVDTEKYNIMFGPDICGSKKMVHLIFNYNGENHLIKKSIRPPNDVYSHAYTLILSPDNTYKVLIDNKEAESGSLSDDKDYDMLAPKRIQDPKAEKPSDWVDAKMMVDESDVKPENWDDIPAEIPDEESEEPDDWDEEEDGVYEVPMVPNPEYQGEWEPRTIENPDYKGPWEHPLVDNPDFKDDPTLYAFNSGAIGIDIWQVKSGSVFDDLLVTNDVEEAKKAAEAIIERSAAEAAAKKFFDDEKAEEKKLKAEEMAKQDADFQDEEDDIEEEDDEEHDEL